MAAPEFNGTINYDPPFDAAAMRRASFRYHKLLLEHHADDVPEIGEAARRISAEVSRQRKARAAAIRSRMERKSSREMEHGIRIALHRCDKAITAMQKRSMRAKTINLPNISFRWTIHKIMHLVAFKYGVAVEDILSENRKTMILRPRQAIMYHAMKKCPQLSTPKIGQILGRDHTSVLHGTKAYCARHGLPFPREINGNPAGTVWLIHTKYNKYQQVSEGEYRAWAATGKEKQ